VDYWALRERGSRRAVPEEHLMNHVIARSALAALVGAAAGLPWLAAGTAEAATAVVYVSPAGSARAADHSCGTAAFRSVQAAVSAVPAHGTVIVCRGTYPESVTIGKALTLAGRAGAVIDAAGQPYGVGTAASWVTVSHLTVENASVGGTLADGIVTAGLVNGKMVPGDHVTITGDVTVGNAGSGIDLNSTSYSAAIGNRSTGNAVGVNVSDDFGQAATHNSLIGNTASANPGGCGIALADHTGHGISRNLVERNTASDNGLGSPTGTAASSGSGVILAGSTGGVFDNTVIGNTFNGNGHAGFDVHAHAPGLNFSGNIVAGNRIGVNNLRTSENDALSTGVYLCDASPLTITVIGNVIARDHYGVFAAGGPVTVTGLRANAYEQVTADLGTSPTF
jgi:hypothetical protein